MDSWNLIVQNTWPVVHWGTCSISTSPATMINLANVCMCACEVWGEVCGMRVEMMASMYSPKAGVDQYICTSGTLGNMLFELRVLVHTPHHTTLLPLPSPLPSSHKSNFQVKQDGFKTCVRDPQPNQQNKGADDSILKSFVSWCDSWEISHYHMGKWMLTHMKQAIVLCCCGVELGISHEFVRGAGS